MGDWVKILVGSAHWNVLMVTKKQVLRGYGVWMLYTGDLSFTASGPKSGHQFLHGAHQLNL